MHIRTLFHTFILGKITPIAAARSMQAGKEHVGRGQLGGAPLNRAIALRARSASRPVGSS